MEVGLARTVILGDLQERKLWLAYVQTRENVLSRMSTFYAPWFIVPANRKWYRDLVDTLKGPDMKFPEAEGDLNGVVIE